MFERFTDRARRVVVLAQEEARMLSHNYIGTEHILLGLIGEGEGVAAEVLQKLGADLNRVRQTVIQLLSGYPGVAIKEIPATGWTPVSDTKGWTPESGPTCPWCTKPLEGALAYRTMVAAPDDDEGDPLSLFLLYCKNCGGIVRTSLD